MFATGVEVSRKRKMRGLDLPVAPVAMATRANIP